MIGQADDAEDHEAELVDGGLQAVEKPPVVAFIPKDCLPAIAAGHGVVGRTRKLDS